MAGNNKSKALRGDIHQATADRGQAERDSMVTAIPGEIVSFDASTQTATVKPLYKPRFNGKPIDPPNLEEVPVMFVRSGGAVMTLPIKSGDKVMLQFQSRSIDNWSEKGEAKEVNSARTHSWSDAVAIPGMFDQSKKLSNFNTKNPEWRSEDGKTAIEMDVASGKFKFRSASGEEVLQILRDFMLVMRSHLNSVPMDAGSIAAVTDAIRRLDLVKL